MNENLENLASSPKTEATELQRLAGEYPNLRPLIAMNPATYPELLDWLAGLNDPAINMALQQRRAAKEAAIANSGSNPQRVSVIQRAGTPVESTMNPGGALPAFIPVGMEEQVIAIPEERNRFGRILIWAVLAIIVVAAALTLIWVLSERGTPKTSDATPPAASGEQSTEVEQQQSADPVAPEEEEATTPELEVKFPAPEQAIEAQRVVSPSGNIACTLGEDGVVCSIFSHSLSGGEVATCQSQPVTLRTTSSFGEVSCATDPVSASEAVTLSYGDYAKYGHGVCYSTENGMSCWDDVSGSSFAVARAGYLTQNQGKIPEDSFWWK